jgi:hypothetical protein
MWVDVDIRDITAGACVQLLSLNSREGLTPIDVQGPQAAAQTEPLEPARRYVPPRIHSGFPPNLLKMLLCQARLDHTPMQS